jgi:hypothetical protein
MLISMWKMYPNSKINVMIIVFVATTFLGTLFLLRTQTLLRCTIYESYDSSSPSAIMTSSNVDLKIQLKNTEYIIAAQEREISK